MNTRWFTLFCCLFFFAACKDETRENPPYEGMPFIQANAWKFYFTDEEGESIIRLSPGCLLPTTFPDFNENGEIHIVPEGIGNESYYLYDNRINSVGYDEEKGLYYWSTYLQGNLWVTESEFYVGFNRTDVDTIRVHFRFSTEGCIGASVCPDPVHVYYNGQQVIRNGNYITEGGIFIRKEREWLYTDP